MPLVNNLYHLWLIELQTLVEMHYLLHDFLSAGARWPVGTSDAACRGHAKNGSWTACTCTTAWSAIETNLTHLTGTFLLLEDTLQALLAARPVLAGQRTDPSIAQLLVADPLL